MIRYVLAALLTVALLALAMPAIDRAATENTDRQVAASVVAIDDAAVSLAENEERSHEDHPDPQRVVDVTLPPDTLTTEGVDHFEIEPSLDHDYSAVRYVLADGTTRTDTIDVAVVAEDPHDDRSVEIGGGGDRELRLALEPDADDEPVVVARWR